jgi:hypothetical protein
MKRIFNLFKKNSAPEVSSARITNETLDHHREKVLAGGRKFKYPIQYARHKLVFNTILISLGAIILLTIIGWWQLYVEQNSSDFFYRITKVLPVPVASIDGKLVAYSDYLMKYISSAHYLEKQEQIDIKTEDGKKQLAYIKQQSMDYVLADSYAAKLAEGLKLSVSDAEVEAFIKSQKQTDGGELSDKTYESVIADYYNWSMDEYRYMVKNELLKQKVKYQIDNRASDLVSKANSIISNDQSIGFKSLADKLNSGEKNNVVYGVSGWVSKFNRDGGLAVEASKMNKNSVSSVVKSTTGNGYYFIKLIDINDSKVNYEYINIPLSQFDEDFKGVVDGGKVKKYISL